MASLGAHIRRTDGHGDLGFHPACPICRDERLAGSFPPTSLSVRRVQAGLAAGAIVMTSIVPTGAFASMGSPEFEGTAPPEAVGDLDKELGAGEDSGVAWQETEEAEEPAADDPATTAGADGAAPEAAGAPGAQAAPEAAPEPEVVDSTEAEAPESEEPVAEETDVPESEAAAPSADPEPEAAAPTPELEAPAAATLTSRDASRAHAKAKREVRREVRRARQEARAASERASQAPTTSAQAAPAASPAPAAPASAVASAPAPRPQPTAPPTTTVKRDTVKPGDRTHVVQRGESLWSIAADLLGDDASPARVAREVNRLWELNKSRIGTGDRDLVHAGTKLRLA